MKKDKTLKKIKQISIRSNLSAGSIVVFGSPNCGWTKKQLANLDERGFTYEFVNCKKESCPDIVNGFPTTVIKGFEEI